MRWRGSRVKSETLSGGRGIEGAGWIQDRVQSEIEPLRTARRTETTGKRGIFRRVGEGVRSSTVVTTTVSKKARDVRRKEGDEYGYEGYRMRRGVSGY